jgi:hypothetical protein
MNTNKADEVDKADKVGEEIIEGEDLNYIEFRDNSNLSIEVSAPSRNTFANRAETEE